jgi:hypothetical protein
MPPHAIVQLREKSMRVMSAVIALAWVGATGVAAAQAPTTPITVKPGDQFTITLDDTQSVDMTGLNMRTKIRTVYAMSVEGPNLWRYTPISLQILEAPKSPLGAGGPQDAMVDAVMTNVGFNESMSAMVRLIWDIGFLCRVDATGRCVSLENWPQWRARLENVVIMADGMVQMAATLPKPPKPAEDAEEPAAPAEQNDERAGKRKNGRDTATRGEPEMETSPAAPPSPAFEEQWKKYRGPTLTAVNIALDSIDNQVAASFLYQIAAPAGLQGRALKTGTAQSGRETWPMPFGAKPVEVDAKVTLTAIDRAAGVARVSRTSTTNQNSVRGAVEASSQFMATNIIMPFMGAEGQSLAAAMTQTVKDAMGKSTISITEEANGEIDLKTGLAKTVTTKSLWAVDLSGLQQSTRAREGAPPTDPNASVIKVEWTQSYAITPGAPAVPTLKRLAKQ